MKKSHAGLLLSSYLLWGTLSVAVFIVFIVLLFLLVKYERTGMAHYFIALLFGFLWIGVTSVTRHVFVLLKKFTGNKISTLEFLSTQFIVLLFPFFYMRLRKEVREYEKKERIPD